MVKMFEEEYTKSPLWGFHRPPISKCLSGLLLLTTTKDLFTQFQNTNRIPVSVHIKISAKLFSSLIYSTFVSL